MEIKDENAFFSGKIFSRNLIIAEEKDRPHILIKIKERAEGEVFVFDAEHNYSDVMNEVLQPSLFGGKKVIIAYDCDNYKDEDWDALLEQKEIDLYILRKTVKKALVQRFSKQGTVLSLLEEKPWDRKNRLVSEVVYTMHKDGVVISQPTAYRFVERVFTDLQLFHNELSKLRSFAQEKKKIEDRDIDDLIKPMAEENGFKVSDEIIWKGNLPNNFTVDSISTLLQILGAFRFQAYLGLKILSKETVKIPAWQEKKYRQKAISYGTGFFKKILKLLYDAEGRAKQSSLTPAALFDLISFEILSLKRKHL